MNEKYPLDEGGVFMAMHDVESEMDASVTETIGLIAGCLTTGSFIPQVFQIIKTRDVSGISLVMYIAFTIGVLLWCIYGISNGQASVIAANGITLALAVIILGMKIKYGKGVQ